MHKGQKYLSEYGGCAKLFISEIIVFLLATYLLQLFLRPSCVHNSLSPFFVVKEDPSGHHFRLLRTVEFRYWSEPLKWVRLWPIFTPLDVNRRWMSFTAGVPKENQHLSGSVPSKEALTWGIQWPKTSATQRTVLLLWHKENTVSNVLLTAKTRGFFFFLYSEAPFCLFVFYFLQLPLPLEGCQ